MGAGTLRAHHCTCLIRESGLLEERAKAQRSPQPTACVVSRSATTTFPEEWPFFQQPLERWLLQELWLAQDLLWLINLIRLLN